MKKIDLGQGLHILANVGVIAGILLLAYELNQNRQMMKAQTRNAISETLVDLILNEVNSPDLTEIDLKAEAGEALTPVEARRHDLSWIASFRYWENVHYQYRIGLYDDSEYLAQREAWREILAEPGVRDLWCARQNRQSAVFGAEMEALLGENRCD